MIQFIGNKIINTTSNNEDRTLQTWEAYIISKHLGSSLDKECGSVRQNLNIGILRLPRGHSALPTQWASLLGRLLWGTQNWQLPWPSTPEQICRQPVWSPFLR